MESKDQIPSVRTRSKRAPLKLDASKFDAHSDSDELTPSSALDHPPTPDTASSSAPPSAARPRAFTQGDAPPSSYASPTSRPSSATHRSRSATVPNPKASSSAPEKERRKRSRVTPEQLAHLEHIFAMDRSPTAARRKEISEMLGMQERQTQIWFQNRRAKAKTLEGKGKLGLRGSPLSGADSPPESASEFGPPYDVDVPSLIHEDEAVTIIPCSDLSIGTWRRIATTIGQHDLIAYICPKKRCFVWYIHSAGYGFKMELPFDSITAAEYIQTSPGQAHATFHLSQPPVFYLESQPSPSPIYGLGKQWKSCADWTEGMQASRVLRHDLLASALPLAHALRALPAAQVRTRSPGGTFSTLGTGPDTLPAGGMHIPQPPMAGLGGSTAERAPHLIHGRKRSYSGPPSFDPAAAHGLPALPLFGGGPQAERDPAGHPSPPYPQTAPLTSSHASGGLPFPGGEFPPSSFSFHGASHTGAAPLRSLSDFSSVPISHAAAPRPYSASPGMTRFPVDSGVPGSVSSYTTVMAGPHGFSDAPSLLSSNFTLGPPDDREPREDMSVMESPLFGASDSRLAAHRSFGDSNDHQAR